MGFFSSIKKVFKKVTNVVKKVLPIALLAGAAIFTGGAALGLAPMAGGWGAAAASLTQTLGLTGTIGSAVTGAVTQAGYGALIGGGLSLASGGDFVEGAAMGALGGAVTGGAMGGFGMATDPLGSTFADQAASTGAAAGSSTPATGFSSAMNLPGGDLAAAKTALRSQFAPVGAASSTPTGFAPVASKAAGGFGQFMKDNQMLLGSVIQGVGGAFGKSDAEEYGDIRQEEYDRIAGSYQMGEGAYTKPIVDNTVRPEPKDAYGDRRRIRYDRERGVIVRG